LIPLIIDGKKVQGIVIKVDQSARVKEFFNKMLKELKEEMFKEMGRLKAVRD